MAFRASLTLHPVLDADVSLEPLFNGDVVLLPESTQAAPITAIAQGRLVLRGSATVVVTPVGGGGFSSGFSSGFDI